MKKILIITLALSVVGLANAAIQPLEGTNVVGFSAVPANLGTNQIITVPYVGCMTNDSAIFLSDLVSINGLVSANGEANAGAADQLIVMTTNTNAELVYYYYYLDSGSGWTAIGTTAKNLNGTESDVTPDPASDFDVARGMGFWLKRVAGSTGDVYVKGELSTSNPSTEIVNGLNLVGYGTAATMKLNSVNWTNAVSETGADGGNGLTTTSDKIIVVENDGSLSYYYYFTRPDTGWDAYPAGSNWITEDYVITDVTIPAGQGFWYLRRGVDVFNFEPDGSN